MRSFGRPGRRVFITLFFSVLIVSLVPILFLSATFYYKSYHDAVDAAGSFVDTYLADFSAGFERDLFASANAAHELLIRAPILEYEGYPDISHFEQLRGPYPSESLIGLYDYLQTKSAALDELREFRNRNPWCLFVEYYHEASGMVLTSGSHGYALYERPGGVPWYAWYRRAWESGITSSLSLIGKGEDGVVNKDALLLTSRPIPSTRRVAVIVYIDYVAMLNDVAKQLPAIPEAGQLTVSSDDSVLFSLRSGSIKTSIDTDHRRSKSTVQVAQMIPATGWNVQLTISKAEYMASLRGIRIIMYLSALLVMVVVVSSSLISVRVSRPLARLAGMLGLPVNEPQSRFATVRNEVQLLERGVVDLLDEKTSLELQVNASKPIYRENFVRGLLFGDTYDPDELAHQFAFLDMELRVGDFVVSVIEAVQVAADSDPGRQRTEFQKVKNAARDVLRNVTGGMDVELSRNRIALVMNATREMQKSVIDVAEKLHAVLLDGAGISVNIGIGYSYREPHLIRRSFEEAQEALMYESVEPPVGGGVRFIGDIRLIRTRPFVYPAEKEIVLANMIMGGNHTGAVRALEAIIDDIKSQRLVLHRYRIHHIILRLINMISDKSNEIDAAYAVPMDEYSWVIHTMEEGGEDEVLQYIRRFIETLTDKIRNSRAEKEQVIVSRICSMIERDYCNITLQAVSDELSLSPSMVSRLFKQIKRIGFSDYLTEYRLERGGELVRDTDMPISDIAHAVGYSNSNYFIRLFKRAKSITPGKYRRSCRTALYQR